MYDFGVLFTIFHPFYAFTILFFICTIFDNAVFKDFLIIIINFFSHAVGWKSHGRDLTQTIPVCGPHNRIHVRSLKDKGETGS